MNGKNRMSEKMLVKRKRFSCCISSGIGLVTIDCFPHYRKSEIHVYLLMVAWQRKKSTTNRVKMSVNRCGTYCMNYKSLFQHISTAIDVMLNFLPHPFLHNIAHCLLHLNTHTKRMFLQMPSYDGGWPFGPYNNKPNKCVQPS